MKKTLITIILALAVAAVMAPTAALASGLGVKLGDGENRLQVIPDIDRQVAGTVVNYDGSNGAPTVTASDTNGHAYSVTVTGTSFSVRVPAGSPAGTVVVKATVTGLPAGVSAFDIISVPAAPSSPVPPQNPTTPTTTVVYVPVTPAPAPSAQAPTSRGSGAYCAGRVTMWRTDLNTYAQRGKTVRRGGSFAVKAFVRDCHGRKARNKVVKVTFRVKHGAAVFTRSIRTNRNGVATFRGIAPGAAGTYLLRVAYRRGADQLKVAVR